MVIQWDLPPQNDFTEKKQKNRLQFKMSQCRIEVRHTRGRPENSASDFCVSEDIPHEIHWIKGAWPYPSSKHPLGKDDLVRFHRTDILTSGPFWPILYQYTKWALFSTIHDFLYPFITPSFSAFCQHLLLKQEIDMRLKSRMM